MILPESAKSDARKENLKGREEKRSQPFLAPDALEAAMPNHDAECLVKGKPGGGGAEPEPEANA